MSNINEHSSSWLPSWSPEYLLKVVIILAVAIYFPVLGHGFLGYDDPVYVQDNPIVLGGFSWESISWAFTTVQNGMWHPLTWVTFLLEVQVFGQNAGVMHLNNLALHLLNIWLVFHISLRILGDKWVALWIAAVMALHPAHIETVAWISERKGLLSSTFYLLALGAYERFARVRMNRKPSLPSWIKVMAFFALGALCKPMVITLPFVFLALDIWPLARVAFPPSKQIGYVGVLGLLSGLIWEKSLLFLACVPLAVMSVGAHKNPEWMPEASTVASAITGVSMYTANFFRLFGYSLVYVRPLYSEPLVVLWALSAIAGVSYALWSVRRSIPTALAGWCWFLLTLAPVTGVIPIGPHFMADRYTYIPYIGLALSTWGLARALMSSCGANIVRFRRAAVAACLLWSLASMYYLRSWRSEESLWVNVLHKQPDNYIACNNLGTFHCRRGQLSEGRRLYSLGLSDRATMEGFENLGQIAQDEKAWARAALYYRAAAELQWDDPEAHFKTARNAVAAKLQGAWLTNAVKHALTACHLTKFENVEYLHVLAEAYENAGHRRGALRLAERGMELARLKGDVEREASFREFNGRLLPSASPKDAP